MDLEQIIKELEKAENDNKKFALLLILAQLMKTNKIKELDGDTSANQAAGAEKDLYVRLFYAINPHFIARLIVSSQVPDNCSKSIFKSVALSILIKFNQYKDLICDPILLSKIKTIIQTLKLSKENLSYLKLNNIDGKSDEEINLEKNLIENTFNYLFALSRHCTNHLCKNGLLDVLVSEYLFDENQYDEDNQIFIDISMQLFGKLCEYDAKYFNYESKNEIFFTFDLIIKKIYQNQDEFKFKLIKMFNKFVKINEINSYFLSFVNENKSSLIDGVLLILFANLFQSKNLKPVIKEDVFMLLDYFIENIEDFLDKIYLKNKQLFYLIAHLVSIEIRLGLEDNTKNFMELCENKNVFLSRLSVYYAIFEKFIIFLSISPLISTEVDEKQIRNFLKLTLETINTIIGFIRDVLANKDYEKFSGDKNEGKLNGHLILISSIRVLACWFSYEEMLEYEIIDLLDEIFRFGDYYVKCFKDKQQLINIYQFLLPGLKRFVSNNESVVDEMKKNEDSKEYDFDLIEKFSHVSKFLKDCSERSSLF